MSKRSTSASEEINDVTLQLKAEQLDIVKEWIETDEVKVFKETFVEEKHFTIPLYSEVIVVEKKELLSASSDQENAPVEVLRIPLSEERVEFTKKKVLLENVSVYKEKTEDIKHIDEVLKREELNLKFTGSPKIKETTL
jgi:uncharacterized protein (TIGR02271 family)